MKRPVERIVAQLGQPGLIDALATQLSGADFTTLMLEVMQRRAATAVSGARHFAHFGLFGLVSAGRDRGAFAFERDAAIAHLSVHARDLRALGAASVQIAPTDFSRGELRAVANGCRNAFDDVPAVVCRDDPKRAGGAGYYQGFCFKIRAAFGAMPLFETSDGGIVDWTQRLVGSAKERCFISGLGIDRVALAITQTTAEGPNDD